jgi:hypothetical protein
MSDLFQPWHLVVLLFAFAWYLFPTIVARHRRCEGYYGILVVNLFLGWTFIGWVVALAWAASGKTEPKAAEA